MPKIKLDLIRSLLLTYQDDFLTFEDGRCIISWKPKWRNNKSDVTFTDTKRVVCPACDGKGTELKGGLKGLAFTQGDRDEMGEHDWNEFSDRMTSGCYDTACSRCKGQNVIPVPVLTFVDKEVLESLQKILIEIDDAAHEAAMEAADEARWGC